MTLVEIIRKDIFDFLEQNQELLFNERDFQIHLASWLRASNNNYDDVDLEYYIPRTELDGYAWDSELRLDIVVKKDGEYCPIELKYKTKKVERQISRFDELLGNKVVVMKNQGAQDLGMYDFWKDVRRVELVCKRFDKVKNGLAVFLTNDPSYTKQGKSTSNHINFSMAEGQHTPQKYWLNPESTCAHTHVNFDLEKEYVINWHANVVDSVGFNYCILTI